MPLGENLKNVREERGITQEKLAEELNINRVNLAYFENGTKVPSVAVLVKIADVLNCSVDGLLDRSNNENRKEESDEKENACISGT